MNWKLLDRSFMDISTLQYCGLLRTQVFMPPMRLTDRGVYRILALEFLTVYNSNKAQLFLYRNIQNHSIAWRGPGISPRDTEQNLRLGAIP